MKLTVENSVKKMIEKSSNGCFVLQASNFAHFFHTHAAILIT